MTASIAGLAGTLALLTWTASAFVQTATTEWVERELTLRGELAVNGARYSLVAAWPSPFARGRNARPAERLNHHRRQPRVVAAEFTRAMDWLSGLIARGQQVGAIRADLTASFLVSVLGAVPADHCSVQQPDEVGLDGMDHLAVALFEMVERFIEPPAAEPAR